jgi:hypothetical protein
MRNLIDLGTFLTHHRRPRQALPRVQPRDSLLSHVTWEEEQTFPATVNPLGCPAMGVYLWVIGSLIKGI